MYWIESTENGRPLFYCDSDSDKTGLPTSSAEGSKSLAMREADYKACPCGSHAFICSTQEVLTLNSNNSWV